MPLITAVYIIGGLIVSYRLHTIMILLLGHHILALAILSDVIEERRGCVKLWGVERGRLLGIGSLNGCGCGLWVRWFTIGDWNWVRCEMTTEVKHGAGSHGSQKVRG